MILTLKKIQHKETERIGMSFQYSFEVNQKPEYLGAVYNSTPRYWNLDYNAANYHLLQKNFDILKIINHKYLEHKKLKPILVAILVLTIIW